jgi:hypothetical protein
MALTIPSLRIDWFCASITAEPADLVDRFSKHLNAEPRLVRTLNGYTHAVGLFVGQDERVRVQWSDTGRPNILATGANAHAVFDYARARLTDYSISRVDVAVDLDSGDWFEVIHGAMRRLSQERQIKHHLHGDWETPGSPDGRTTYSGTRKSAMFRRLYEYAKCHGYGEPVRYEIEIKPNSKMKSHYSTLSALDLFQSDAYSVELFRRLGFHTDRYRIVERSTATPQSAWFTHLVRQYGPKLMELLKYELDGDVNELGVRIIRAYEIDCEDRDRIKAAARLRSTEVRHDA